VNTLISLSSKNLFLLTDSLAGGLIQILKRRLKFKLRFLLYRKHIETIQYELNKHGLEPLLASDTALLLRPIRSYLWTGLSPSARVKAFQQHFNWLLHQYKRETVLEFYRSGTLQLAKWARDQNEVSVALHPSRGLGREGELELHLSLDGQVVLRAAFSVLVENDTGKTPQEQCLVIGAVQGSRDGADLMRNLTKAMERALPRTVLIAALQGLSCGWQLSGIRGVSSKAHVFVGYGRTLARRVAINYDELWSLSGGRHENEATHWVLPMQPHHRDLAEVPSKKRAEHRRRNILLDQIFEDCSEAARTKPFANSD